MPEGRIFLIPVRFEECDVPFSLSRYQWVDLFDEAGYARMMRALKFRASQLQRATVELPKKEIEAERLALEKAAREKQERVAADKAERAAQEKLQREAAEKAIQEKAKLEQERARKRGATLQAKKDNFPLFTSSRSELEAAIHQYKLEALRSAEEGLEEETAMYIRRVEELEAQLKAFEIEKKKNRRNMKKD